MEQTMLEPVMKSLRFGGISPEVLRELSGVYQPFVKAVKEIISNSYDADAETVELEFGTDFDSLSITDNGSGMGPLEFVRDYIRIGKSFRKDEFTAIKKRPRIGGKGIGFLAPARYCEMIEVKTKKKESHRDKIIIELQEVRNINVRSLFLQGHENEVVLNFITLDRVTDEKGNELAARLNGFEIEFENKINDICHIWYNYDSSGLELTAKINFDSLFSMDSTKSLENIENFCEILIESVSEERKKDSYTKITLHNIKEFVRSDLKDEGKKGARNVESFGGLEQFEWHLSRIIPVNAQKHECLPKELQDYILNEIDRDNDEFPIKIISSGKPLERRLIKPTTKLSIDGDQDLIKQFELFNIDGTVFAKGFLVGQSSIILPAELRGILIRVKGVAVGEPTFFGFDQILSGSSKVALTQISGEINIFSGIDAIQDINPGREGFYKESKTYNLLKKQLVGEQSDRVTGIVKELIDAIIARSEINASLGNFKKKYQSYRTAILETSAAIADMASENSSLEEAFFNSTDMNDLKLCPPVLPKAEGKLATFSMFEVEDLAGAEDGCKVDFEKKELYLDKKADIWKRNINIGGLNYDIELKQGKQKKVKMFCQINPLTRKIFINWDHPIRTSMGDTQFIKHCLATIASELPQEQLDMYVSLMTKKT